MAGGQRRVPVIKSKMVGKERKEEKNRKKE
jgi:hypothetical protein